MFKIILFISTALFFYTLGNDNGINYTAKKVAEKIEESKSLDELKAKLGKSL